LLLEGLAVAFGVVALSVWGVAKLAGSAGARQDLKRFEVTRDARGEPSRSLPTLAPSDVKLWNWQRVREWRASLTAPVPSPLAVLRIPTIELEVSVLPGTDELVLNRGVGHIASTALPGTNSNSGIAGHRDGYFRRLKDLAPGDAIELETLEGRQMYRVERTWIVDANDVSVLEPTPVRSLTLVTCYPFRFVGSAPRRFIVRAIADG
jgi:sortase A